jgi:hypothetical protein
MWHLTPMVPAPKGRYLAIKTTCICGQEESVVWPSLIFPKSSPTQHNRSLDSPNRCKEENLKKLPGTTHWGPQRKFLCIKRKPATGDNHCLSYMCISVCGKIEFERMAAQFFRGRSYPKERTIPRTFRKYNPQHLPQWRVKRGC